MVAVNLINVLFILSLFDTLKRGALRLMQLAPKLNQINHNNKELDMITEREKEEKKKIKLVVESYNNIDDMFNDLKSKLEIFANLSLDNESLSYSLAMYSDELRILIDAIHQKID